MFCPVIPGQFAGPRGHTRTEADYARYPGRCSKGPGRHTFRCPDVSKVVRASEWTLARGLGLCRRGSDTRSDYLSPRSPWHHRGGCFAATLSVSEGVVGSLRPADAFSLLQVIVPGDLVAIPEEGRPIPMTSVAKLLQEVNLLEPGALFMHMHRWAGNYGKVSPECVINSNHSPGIALICCPV